MEFYFRCFGTPYVACTLLDKLSRRCVAFTPDDVGFTIPDNFVAGYGLDVAGAYRNIPPIANH